MTITREPIQKPETDWRDEDYYAALRWVNEQRVTRFGLEPLDDLPVGSAGRAHSCPVSMALGNRGVGHSWVRLSREREDLPPFVTRFIQKVDRGYYPALIEN